MKELLELIDNKKQEFAQLPLFEFVQDPSISPEQRLAFAPCLSFFAMSFKDINEKALRADSNHNKLQELINQHTYEDCYHWVWFLGDMQKLGHNQSSNSNDTLRFLWGEETKATRSLSYKLYGYTFEADPILKLAAIEAIEATGNVFLSCVAQVATELEAITKQKYLYFGEHHLDRENGHTTDSDEGHQFIENIQLTEENSPTGF